MKHALRTLFILAMLATAGAGRAFAQTSAAADSGSALSVGRKGASQLGFNFMVFANPTTTTEVQGTTLVSTTTWSGLYLGGVDIGRFTTDRLVLSLGGDISGVVGAETSMPTVSGRAGFLLYATPDRVGSLYVGGDYSLTLTNRFEGEAGLLNARIGIQSAVRTSASIFFEGGYGQQLRDLGSAGVLSARIGLRILFR